MANQPITKEDAIQWLKAIDLTLKNPSNTLTAGTQDLLETTARSIKLKAGIKEIGIYQYE